MICSLIAYTIVCQITWSQFFYAIRQVETPPGTKISEEYKGPYEISWAYWYDSGIPGRWEDCIDDTYSKRVMMAYWNRYNREAVKRQDWETLARIHNGGPLGAEKETTKRYWTMVKNYLKESYRSYD